MTRNETLTPHESLAANGRSFHWANRFLGARMGKNAARLYAFCRLLDDMADDDIPDGLHASASRKIWQQAGRVLIRLLPPFVLSWLRWNFHRLFLPR